MTSPGASEWPHTSSPSATSPVSEQSSPPPASAPSPTTSSSVSAVPSVSSPVSIVFRPPTVTCGHILIPASNSVIYALDTVPGPAGDYIAPPGLHTVFAVSAVEGGPTRTWTLRVPSCPPRVAVTPRHVSGSPAALHHVAAAKPVLASTGTGDVLLAGAAVLCLLGGLGLSLIKRSEKRNH